ncbi:MAG: hypothetical protein QXL17_02890 [Candidatus Thermoplasmatota archaeon]
MYIEDITRLNEELVCVKWVGQSIDEKKILDAVTTTFPGMWELVDFSPGDEEADICGTAFVKQLVGDRKMNEDIRELEAAQIKLANGGIEPTPEVLPPVSRVQMTDEEVDALIESAEKEEAELLAGAAKVQVESFEDKLARDAANDLEVPTKTKRVKKTEEKKVKKIDVARKIFASNTKQSRKVVIEKIMEKTGLSKVAAATYYQICKRES